MKFNNLTLKSFFNNHWQLLGIVLGGLALRLYKLTSISLWHDEAFSALLIKYSWSEMMYRIGLDVHPPMYYIFLRIWHYIFGHSLFSLRGMSVFFGVATIILAYLLVQSIFKNKKLALLTALLIAVNPFQVQYVNEARMYTMGAFFALLSALLLVKAIQWQKKFYLELPNPKYKIWFVLYYLLFSISSAIAILTHYYLLFSFAALGIYGLICHYHSYKLDLKKYFWISVSGIIALLGFLPWLKVFLFQYKQVGAGYWIPPINIWSIPRTLYDLLIRIAEPEKYLLIGLSIVSLWVIYRFIKSNKEFDKWLILSGFLAPFAGAILFWLIAILQKQNSSVFLVRYFIFASSFYLIIWASTLLSLKRKSLKVTLICVLVIVNLFSTFYFWQELDTDKRTGMAAAAKHLAANVEPGNQLYVGSSFVFFNYKYYNQTPTQPFLYSGGSSVTDLPHFAGTAILTDQELIKNFNDRVLPGDTVWLLWTTGFGSSKPEVPGNWNQISEAGFEDVKPYPGSWIVVTEYKVN